MPSASTEGQQNLNSVLIEDVLEEPAQVEALERALEIITDDEEDECPTCSMQGFVMSARTPRSWPSEQHDGIPTRTVGVRPIRRPLVPK